MIRARVLADLVLAWLLVRSRFWHSTWQRCAWCRRRGRRKASLEVTAGVVRLYCDMWCRIGRRER